MHDYRTSLSSIEGPFVVSRRALRMALAVQCQWLFYFRGLQGRERNVTRNRVGAPATRSDRNETDGVGGRPTAAALRANGYFTASDGSQGESHRLSKRRRQNRGGVDTTGGVSARTDARESHAAVRRRSFPSRLSPPHKASPGTGPASNSRHGICGVSAKCTLADRPYTRCHLLVSPSCI